MSAMSWSAQVFGRRSGCLLNAAMTRGNTPATIRQCTRHVATAAKPRATKKAATSSEDAVAATKKSLSTKSPATTSAKTPRKKKAETVASEPAVLEDIAVAPKKSARAASTKTAAVTPKKKAEVKSPAVPVESKTMPVRPYQPRPFPVDQSGSATPKPVDVKSPEYKQAARKWTSLMVALPILAVSSYYLFDRLALGNEPKGLETLRKASSPLSTQPKTPED
ncbi:hypothetical protein B0T14DRAFT_531076 [Immersiella caudata]|uniref:Uncharacterized protein n=1 Tax=Immersiella caudata TaxID=314043 RepID=A0AA39TNT0_9PEZI|nr:hypothetical protein B0T14DRAFT_531076 [Immersiella caudata]